MKLPVEWLREYVQTDLSDAALADELTMVGLEVEETTASPAGDVFHIKITPNRGDWLSARGVAREAAAALDLALVPALLPEPDERNDASRWASVKIERADLCSRYCAKVLRNVRWNPTPDWIQRRLLACGMRPINVVVDITNYVMLELGQPLHAFDADKIPEGRIIVRLARESETLRTLDGVERALDPEMLVIADEAHPIALAGVMGGADTEVDGSTRSIILESAHFDPSIVRRAAKKLGLSTEASYRFERGVDPELPPVALERAAELLADLAGCEAVLGKIDLHQHLPERRTIALRPSRARALLGIECDEDAIAHSLRRLGMTVDSRGPTLSVIVPPFRPDLTAEIDLVEEVGRMVGYENIPERRPSHSSVGSESELGAWSSSARAALRGMGMQEVLTHSLSAPAPWEESKEAGQRVQIRSALSAELSGLRQSLIPNLLQVLARNGAHGERDAQIFEIGKVFSRGAAEGEYAEAVQAAGACVGAVAPRSWSRANPPAADFFFMKGAVEALARDLHFPALTFRSENRPGMHPGRCAAVVAGDQTVGYVAEVDPFALSSDFGIEKSAGRAAVFQLNLSALAGLSRPAVRFAPLPRFPSSSRDLNIVLADDIPYDVASDVARAAADPTLLENVSLISVYAEPPIPAGSRALALRLVFRSPERTLTDSEVESQMAAIESALRERLGAARR